MVSFVFVCEAGLSFIVSYFAASIAPSAVLTLILVLQLICLQQSSAPWTVISLAFIVLIVLLTVCVPLTAVMLLETMDCCHAA